MVSGTVIRRDIKIWRRLLRATFDRNYSHCHSRPKGRLNVEEVGIEYRVRLLWYLLYRALTGSNLKTYLLFFFRKNNTWWYGLVKYRQHPASAKYFLKNHVKLRNLWFICLFYALSNFCGYLTSVMEWEPLFPGRFDCWRYIYIFCFIECYEQERYDHNGA